MFWSSRTSTSTSTSASRDALINASVNPRLRRLLTDHIQSASQTNIERLSWLFWLLRARQPKRVLIDGPLSAPTALMVAAAISFGPAGRIQAATEALSLDVAASLSSAGLDWVWLHGPRKETRAHGYDALVLVGSTDKLKDDLSRWTPQLNAGALIIVMNEGSDRAPSSLVYEELFAHEPGLECLALAPDALPLITLIWRGH